MTAWIFGANSCKCGTESSSRSGAFKQPPSVKRATSHQSIQSAGSIPTAAELVNPNIASPDLGERFAVLDFLGQGGMGAVYKVREKATNKVYAVKILKAELAQDAASVKRFELEVKAAGELTHPNLVFIYGAHRTPDGTPYMVMNFVDGISLADCLETDGSLTARRAIPIFEQVAEALAHVVLLCPVPPPKTAVNAFRREDLHCDSNIWRSDSAPKTN